MRPNIVDQILTVRPYARSEVKRGNMILTHRSQPHGTHSEAMLRRRPRLLFLTWNFPPAKAIACVRTWSTAKYLARLGWDVTVVTPHPSVWRHLEDPEATEANLRREGIRRILTGHRWRCLMPDHLHCWRQGIGGFAAGVCRHVARRLGIDKDIGWIKAAEHACAPLTAQDADIILACGPPFAAFRLAKRLSDRLGRPYVLDYRDPWTRFLHTPRSIRPSTIREEARLLASCAAVTIVSRSWSSDLDRRFGVGSKLHVITNGYDLEELTQVEPYSFGHFAIVYAGRFYPPKRVITPVMAALKLLNETVNGRSGEWYFHYYGTDPNHVSEEAKRFGLMERVVLHGLVPRTEALSAIRGAGVAVVITSVLEEDSLEAKGIVTGKVFEILGQETPILLVAPSESDARVIAESTGLAQSFTGSDTEGMAAFLRNAMLGRNPKPNNVETYAWPNIAKRFDAILRRALVTALHD
jgi:glycosyltransferase involved in cell wall biosynthesis